MKQCEFPKCGRGKSRCMCEGDPVTAPTPDAVAQARREVLDARDNALRNISMEAVARLDAAWDTYDTLVGAAVRAECAAKEADMRLVGWMAVDAQGERMADEMFVSSVVALKEWPTCHPVPLYTHPISTL